MRSASRHPGICYLLLTSLEIGVKRGNLAHSCLLKASFTAGGVSPDCLPLGVIHPHSLHPQAAKVLSSSHTNALAIIGIFCHKWYGIVHCGYYSSSGQDLLGSYPLNMFMQGISEFH